MNRLLFGVPLGTTAAVAVAVHIEHFSTMHSKPSGETEDAPQ